MFHGDDGLDELTTTGPSTVWVVRDGTVSQTRFDPAALGLSRSRPGDLRGGDPAHNAAVVHAVLAGERGPVRETVLLNAAAALAADGGVPGAAAWPRRWPTATPGRRRPSTPARRRAAGPWVDTSQRLAAGLRGCRDRRERAAFAAGRRRRAAGQAASG